MLLCRVTPKILPNENLIYLSANLLVYSEPFRTALTNSEWVSEWVSEWHNIFMSVYDMTFDLLKFNTVQSEGRFNMHVIMKLLLSCAQFVCYRVVYCCRCIMVVNNFFISYWQNIEIYMFFSKCLHDCHTKPRSFNVYCACWELGLLTAFCLCCINRNVCFII